ncbi:MAG: macro domain-containing protein [Planctomycetes bacterium]|nr:macro domain-containing protein [Planctomycetota bacterium]
MFERRVGAVAVTLVQGDIAGQQTDAVVNAANNHLWMGSGVAGAVKRRGGIEIEREAVELGPISVGQAVTTSAGRLDARYVIHAAAMGDAPTDIASATRASFNEARRLSLASVSFPALATGVAGVPVDRCARIMLPIALETARNPWDALREIRFVLWAQPDFETFLSVLREL